MSGVRPTAESLRRMARATAAFERMTGAGAIRHPKPRRVRGRGGGSTLTQRALLFKTLPPATYSITQSGGSPSEAHVAPSAKVEQCVIPLRWETIDDEDEETSGPGRKLVHRANDEEEIVIYDAVNCCWPTHLVAGTGAAIMDESEPPEPTGETNPPPMLVEGELRTYQVTEGEGEEEETVTKQVFVILDVINPLTVITGTTAAAIDASVEPDFDAADGHSIRFGRMWTARPHVLNELGWDADEGAKFIAVGPVDDAGDFLLINIECPESQEPPPEEES